MAEGLVLPYLDIPFQHASPKILRAMRRPANDARVLERIRGWREVCPDIAIRSSFVVGFPGETEEDFQYLLDWLEEAQLDRVGAFRFEPVEGAAANALPDPVPEEVKQERFERIMALSARISAAKLRAKVGKSLEVLIDSVDKETGGATGRSKADAPEIDGEVHLRDAGHLAPGDIVTALIEDSDEHDLFGVPIGAGARLRGGHDRFRLAAGRRPRPEGPPDPPRRQGQLRRLGQGPQRRGPRACSRPTGSTARPLTPS